MKYLWMIDVFIWIGFAFSFLVAMVFIYLFAFYILSELASRKIGYRILIKEAKNNPKTFMRFISYLKRKYKINHRGRGDLR